MKVSDIINAVRWCIDEESNNISDLAEVTDERDDSYMDNIIVASIPAALHWIAITSKDSPILSSSSTTGQSASIHVEQYEDSDDIGVITMPSNVSVFNINRVRAKGWQKAVIPIEDTDDRELFMFDETERGTKNRPIAAIIRNTPLQLLIQPKPSDGEVSISYVGVPIGITADNVDISDTFKTAFIYYLAFLLLSAYNDTKASQMYTIALQQLGVNQSSK